MTSIPESLPRASASENTIQVRVLLFGLYAELAGEPSVVCELPAPATVASVVANLRARLPGLDRMPARVLVAVNQIHAREATPVSAGDEVAILPPLAGG